MYVSYSLAMTDAMDASRLQQLKAGACGSYQFVEDAVVELHLGPAAFPELVVVVLETLPVGLELIQAVGVDVLDAVKRSASSPRMSDKLEIATYTLAAQRVTFRPSFKQSISPRPLASSLHFM